MTRYSATRLQVLRRCLAEHHLQYTVGIRVPSWPAAEFGKQGHRALEAYFKAWELKAPREMRLNAGLAELAKVADLVDRAKLEVLLVGYDERWGGEPWEILGVEVEFEYQLGRYNLFGRIDVIVRDQRDGRVFVVEHKHTTQDTTPGTAYWEKLTIDGQVSIYIDGAASLGHDVAGCIYDVLVKPQHDLLLATPEDKREYTKGKGCKACGGKVGVAGSGNVTVDAEGQLPTYPGTLVACSDCNGTGWKEAPALYAKQRAKDETIDEFRDRLVGVIGENPLGFFQRQPVVRLVDELPRMRLDLQQAIWLAEEAAAAGVKFRNTDACKRGRDQLCFFFPVCSGKADVNDTVRFPRRSTSQPVST